MLCSLYEFKVTGSIPNIATYKVWAVISLLHMNGEIAAEIHYQIIFVYCKNVMNIYKTWQKGVMNIKTEEVAFGVERDEIRSRRPSVFHQWNHPKSFAFI